MAKKTDTKTLELINEINRRKAEIAKAERPNWATNCSFTMPGEGTTNLHVESDIRKLVGFVAFLRERERAYNEAAKELGVDAPPYQHGGFTATDWIEDLKTRINKIQIAAKRSSLEILEKRLNAIISPELRAELELKAIEEAMKG